MLPFAENSLAKVKATGETSKEGITKFLLSVKLKVEYASFQMESLLSGFGNRLINDNYKIFLEELVPGLESSLSRQFSDIVNIILKDSTYEGFYPLSLGLVRSLIFFISCRNVSRVNRIRWTTHSTFAALKNTARDVTNVYIH